MDYAIQIKLTAKQYHLLKELAGNDYRTIGNTAAMLLATGFGWYINERDLYIKKMEQDREADGGEYQYYTDEEMKEIIDLMPLKQ